MSPSLANLPAVLINPAPMMAARAIDRRIPAGGRELPSETTERKGRMNTRHFIAVNLALLLTLPDASAQNSGDMTIDYVPSAELGMGWNSITGKPTHNRCILFRKKLDPGSRRYVDFRRVTDSAMLQSALNISAEAKAKGVFGSAGAKASFSQTQSTSLDTLTVAAIATVVNEPEVAMARGDENAAGTIMLDDKFAKLSRSHPGHFLTQCGDSFVKEIQRGAEIVGTLNSSTTEETMKSEAMAEIRADFTTWAFNGRVDTSRLEKRKKYNFHVNYQQVGTNETKLSTTYEGLVAAVEALPEAAIKGPVGKTMRLERYDITGNWGGAEGATWLQKQYLPLVNQYLRYASLEKEIANVVSTQDKYILGYGTNLQSVKDMGTELQAKTILLKNALQKCINSSNSKPTCSIPKSASLSDYDYLYRIPLRKGSFPLDAQLQSDLQALEIARASERTTSPTNTETRCHHREPVSRLCVGEHQVRVANPAYDAIRANIERLKGNITTAENQYVGELRKQTLEQRVQYIAMNRCSLQSEDLGCLTYAEIDAYKPRIDTLIPTPVLRSTLERRLSPEETRLIRKLD
ncbi:hypothetical protein [Pseudoxanthomonas spadix]|uniref:hypothetical protein n=1 Tax=Pseudoxanthomonas spadix TaxID=415229 RepID=UPI0013052DDF|nr:hypothetical protein [Pseudoxanthomonas spadix]